jgi:hypothetical protein
MPITIIKTADRKPYREQYYALQAKYFNHPDCPYDQTPFKGWSETPFFVANVGVDEKNTVQAFISFMITNQGNYESFIAGKIKDWEIKPYHGGDNIPGYLFWDALILEDRHYTPYLLKYAFREIENIMRTWKINIPYVFAIAYTPVSERLMRRYAFKKVGVYDGHYPVMCANVLDNIWLKTFIPYIFIESRPPFDLRPDHPIPDMKPREE